MRINEISTSRLGHARIIHLRPNRCDGAVNMALGFQRRTLCCRSHVLPCEP